MFKKKMLYHLPALLFVALLACLGSAGPARAGQAGVDWVTVNYSLDHGWNAITYGNGAFVAVASDGAGNRVMTSPDGVTWTIRSSAADNNWQSVTYGNGLFVAVAATGVGNRVMTSPDGKTWTSRTSAADNNWRSVVYGNSLFVAVANSGTGNRVMTSPDGITWTIQTSAADNNWYSVTYGNGLFVAVAITGTGNRVMTSPDGITWTIQTSAADNNWYSVTYGNGLFVAVAQTGVGNRVMTSPDGKTWTVRSSAADNNWYSVTYGNNLFVAVAATGTGNRIMTSPDGITWTARTSAADNNWRSVVYGNNLFVAVAATGTGNRIMTSPDGITWTAVTYTADNYWNSVTYGNGLFVAVSFNGTGNRVMTSPDGLTWTSRTSAADYNWKSVTYGNNLFVAVAGTGTVDRVMTSPDGITWTIRTAASGNVWPSVTYGNGLFVAVAQPSIGTGVMTSPDGIAWTARTQAANNIWYSVTYGNNLFVAVAKSGTGNRVMTSPDGITWTIRTSAADNVWYSVTYGNGLFVAVSDAAVNGVMTSPDGITWTSRSSATGNLWNSVTYGNGLFVAVAQTGVGNRVMTSPDGITWTAQTSSANNDWQSVTYGNGLFVAVAGTGVGNRVMISGGSSSQSITVDQAAPASALHGSTFDVKAHASSGLAVAVTTGGVCSGSGASSGTPGSPVTITMTGGAGTCTVNYDQAGDANYDPATQVVNSTTAGKASQSITVATAAPAGATYGASFTVAAHATSALAVTYSSGSPTVCTNSGATFTMISGSGSCTVQYDAAGSADFTAAPQVVQTTPAGKAAPACIVTPYSVTYDATAHTATGSCTGVGGATISGLVLTGTAHTGAGSYSSDAWSFTDATGNYSNASGTVSDSIAKAAQAIVTLSGVPATSTVGATFTAVAAGGSGTSAYSFAVTGTACTVNTSTGAVSVTHVTGGCSVTAVRALDANYNVSASSAAAAITTINKANQATVTLSGVPATATMGGTFTALAAGGSGTGLYSYAVTGTACTVNTSTGAGAVTHVTGGCSVIATRALDSDYNVASSTAAAITTINKANQATVTLSGVPVTATMGGTFTALAAGGSGTGLYSYAVTGTACTVNASTGAGAVIHVTGGCSVTATRALDTDYNVSATSTAAAITTISKVNQATVTLSGVPATATIGDTFTALAAGGSGTGAYSYAVTGTACTVDSSTGAGSVTHVTGGCSVIATRASDSDYNVASSAAAAITTINKAAQATVTLSGVPTTATMGDTFTALAAGGSGTGAYSYAVTGTACTVDSSTGAGSVTHVTGGCSVIATRASDSDYNVASSAAAAITTINKANQATVSLSGVPATATMGGTFTALAAGGSGTGSYSYAATGTACTVDSSTGAGSVTHVTGGCSVTATRALDSDYNVSATSAAAAITTITKATPNVTTWASASAITYGQTLADSTLSGGASTPSGSFTFTTPTTAPNAGTALQDVTFTPTNSADYLTATGSSSVTVNKATATVALSNLTQSYSGSSLTPTAVTNPVGLTIDWTNAPATNAGSYAVTATINSSNYQGSSSGEFVIGKVTPTLSVTLTQQSYDGSSHGATVTSSVAGSVTNTKYNGIATVPFTAGTYTVTADFTPADANYTSLTGASAGNFTIARAVPALAVTNSPLIYTGSAKGVIVTGNIPGGVSGVTYNGSSTQPINAGIYEVKVNFAPADSTNYGPLTNAPAGSFTIAKATPTLGVTNSPVSFDGSGHGATVTGSVAGSVSGVLTGGAASQNAGGTYAVTADFTPSDSSNYSSLTGAPAGNFAILAASKVSVTIQTVPAGLNVTVDGGAAQIAPYTFTATPGLNYTIATTSPQGTIGTRYLFAAWSDGSKAISRPITAPNTGSATYTATFTTEYQLTTAVSPVGSGAVLAAVSNWYAAGSSPSVIATAGSGYTFSSWSGPAGNYTSSATNILMNGPTTVTAMFKPVTTTLSAAIDTPNKSGSTGGIRTWPVILTPSGGASAAAVQITGLTISSSGTCKPVVTSAFPRNLGDIAAGNTGTGNVTVDFSTCSAAKQKSIKFNVTIDYSSVNGAVTGSTSLTGVGQ